MHVGISVATAKVITAHFPALDSALSNHVLYMNNYVLLRCYPMIHTCAIDTAILHTDTILYWYRTTALQLSIFLICQIKATTFLDNQMFALQASSLASTQVAHGSSLTVADQPRGWLITGWCTPIRTHCCWRAPLMISRYELVSVAL